MEKDWSPFVHYFNKTCSCTRLLSLFVFDCTRGIDEPPKEIGNFPFHTILVIDKSMLGGMEWMELT